MKNIVFGILAHVDSGKTTLSEGMLYECKSIRKLGRVDHGDTALDTNEIEKNRGITVFSKQAKLTYRDTCAYLIDTPGHVDFSAEMERTLSVLDYAILVISGTDGIQNHTETLWQLLERYSIPTFIFVNKMDLAGADKDKVLSQLQTTFSSYCTDFTTLTDDVMDSHFSFTNSSMSKQGYTVQIAAYIHTRYRRLQMFIYLHTFAFGQFEVEVFQSEALHYRTTAYT